MSAYAGPAVVRIKDTDLDVDVHLSGRFDPLVGDYSWSGRVDPHPGLPDMIDRSGRDVTVHTPGGVPVPGHLGERNPWGGYRISGRGRPPYPLSTEDVHVDADS